MISLYLLISVMPMMRHPFWSDFIGDLTMIKYLGIFCLGSALLHLPVRRQPPSYFATPQAAWFLVFAAVALCSYLFFGTPLPFEVSPFMSLVSFGLLFFVTLTLVDSLPRLRLVLFVAIGSVSYASLNILREWQKSGGMSFGYRPGWVTGDPNYYSASALLCLPLAFYLPLAGLRPSERWFCRISLGVTLCGLLLASSRGALLGLVAMMLLAGSRAARRARAYVLLSVAVLPLMVLTPASPLARLINPSPSDWRSAELRTFLWQAGYTMFLDSPLTGVGIGNFKARVGYFSLDETILRNVSHNTYLEVAAEMGLAGLLSYLGVVGGTFVTLKRVRRAAAASRQSFLLRTAQGLETGLLGFLVTIFFLSALWQKLFWLLVFVVMALPPLVTAAARPAPYVVDHGDRNRWPGAMP
jgi:putative inorganic carbon (HCO3(-)) transporter